MSWTLQTIQDYIASEVDQSSSAPTAGGEDWDVRLNIINRSLRDWAETYDWKTLLKIHNGLVTAAGFATYSLPSDFKKIDGYPQITWDGRTTDNFPLIDPSTTTLYNDSDKYAYVTGAGQKALYIHANTLSSGASVAFTYFSVPSSLASPTDVVVCDDPNYIVQRSLYHIYKAKEDGRFPEAKAEADRIMARMIENESALGLAHTDRRVSRWEDTHYGFRIGRD